MDHPIHIQYAYFAPETPGRRIVVVVVVDVVVVVIFAVLSVVVGYFEPRPRPCLMLGTEKGIEE